MPRHWAGCPIETEYFGEDRKLSKAERKRATAKDRSKYKKTDQRKLDKQKLEAAPMDTGRYEEGRVLSIASQGIAVQEADGKMLNCTLRGVLKKDKTEAKNLVVAGDIVLFERTGKSEGLIVQVEPRRTCLSRAENLSRRKEQLIAANIDQVFITTSVVAPALKAPLIDRYIIAAQKGGMEPIVVVNKIDLLTSKQVDQALQLKEAECFQELIKAYKAADVKVIPISVVSGEGVPLLKKAMEGKASVFSGQSGVGKSSLINIVTGLELKMGGMVEKTNKGTHTTTMAQLIPLEFGGWCIDTPGIKSFGVWNLEREEIQSYFPEIFACGLHCHFVDCSHLHEAGCAVLQALEKGEISPMRYESFQMLIQSASETHFRR